MANRIALDTNILIYLHDSNSNKRNIAQKLIVEDPIVCTQVISEYLNVARRLLPLSKEEILKQASVLFSGTQIFAVNTQSMDLAAYLIKKYQFQMFDAVIVASALQANCDVLYSEDMHHGLVVEKNLTIMNPF